MIQDHATSASAAPSVSGTSSHIPATATSGSANIRGSLDHDSKHGYTLKWDSWAVMMEWKDGEEGGKMIEFIRKQSQKSTVPEIWTEKVIFVCSRGHSGGKSKYEKKHNWDRKVPGKKSGCKARLTVKTYPHTSIVLGLYTGNHDHPVGNANTKFTRLSKDTRQEIERLLRLGVDPAKVLDQIQGGTITEDNLDEIRSGQATRNQFATRRDVRRIQKMIEEEVIRLASQDGASVLEWVKRLRECGHYVELKTSSDPPLAGSGLERGSFVLVIQTKYQREYWEQHGGRYAGIDATHNTTHYENMSLFSVLVRDPWGQGMPCAFMVSSNAQQETITYFLRLLRTRSPGVQPKYFMSDKDTGQLNAITLIYPESKRLLCWWHVLHAWQQHFITQHYVELWKLLQKWIRITDETEFRDAWEKIREMSPPSLINYFETYWLQRETLEMWSAVYRKDRSIFELSDTNMLVEAWHHLLKGDFLQGKRNRRLDHLIYILTDVAMRFFIRRHRRQEFGFEGPNLEMKRRFEIEQRGNLILRSDIEVCSTQEDSEADADILYKVKSQSDHSLHYEVDVEAYTCTCLSFPVLRYCKHICAVQLHFPEAVSLQPHSILNVGKASKSVPIDEDNVEHATDGETDPPENNDNMVSQLIQKLSALELRLRTHPPSSVSGSLREFYDHLSAVTTELSDTPILPQATKIAPNQHSWPETRTVMNVPVKTKKRPANEDPYGGGEKSGKKAKQDARLPLANLDSSYPTAKLPISQSVPPTSMLASLPSIPSQPKPPVTQPIPLAANFASPAPGNTPTLNLYDPALLRDHKRLSLLERNPHLNELAALYHIPAKGTNADIIARLQNPHENRFYHTGPPALCSLPGPSASQPPPFSVTQIPRPSLPGLTLNTFTQIPRI